MATWAKIRNRLVARLAEYNAGAPEAAADASVSDATIYDVMTEVYRELVNEANAIDPSKFSSTTTFAYAANTESVALPAGLVGRPIASLQVQNGTLWLPVQALTQAEVDDILAGADYAVADDPAGFGYFVEKQANVYLVPKPSTAQTVRVRYLEPIVDLDSTTDGGNSPTLLPEEHHGTIALAGALKFIREASSNSSLEEEYARAYERLIAWATSSPKKNNNVVRDAR